MKAKHFTRFLAAFLVFALTLSVFGGFSPAEADNTLTEEQRKMLTAYFAGDFSLKLRAFGGDSAKKCLKRLEAYQ